jgi:hypothetical protein
MRGLATFGIGVAGMLAGGTIGVILDLAIPPVPPGTLAVASVVLGGFAALQWRKFH